MAYRLTPLLLEPVLGTERDSPANSFDCRVLITWGGGGWYWGGGGKYPTNTLYRMLLEPISSFVFLLACFQERREACMNMQCSEKVKNRLAFLEVLFRDVVPPDDGGQRVELVTQGGEYGLCKH